MSNQNKEVSIAKDDKLDIRISSAEKELFAAEAKKRNMTLSEFVLRTIRKEILKQDILEKIPSGENIDLSEITSRLDHLEKQVKQNHQENINLLTELSQEAKDDLLLYATSEKIYWMLLQEKFQKKTHKEIKEQLIKADPSLQEQLEESPRRLFTALDLALEKLVKEKMITLLQRGTIEWKK